MASVRAAKLQAQKQATKNDPNGWASLTLPKIHFWSKQIEIIEAVDRYPRVAVRACHDSSKSFTAAVIAARWLDTHKQGEARVITTAPTGTQVRAILWVEINQLHEQADLPGRVNQTEWWVGSYLAGLGRKPADYNPAAFQGLHARYPLIIIDEAAGVPSGIIEAAETLATNVNAKILMIGNPDDPTSLFADIHANPAKHGYHTIKIAAWDTPNFTGEEVTPLLNEVLLSKQWVEQRRQAWGTDHPFWLSKVEAEFPAIDTNSVIKLHDLIATRVPFSERLAADTTTIDGAEKPHQFTSGQPLPTAASTPGTSLPSTSDQWAGTPNWTVLGVDVAGSDDGDETVCRLIIPHNTPTIESRYRSSDPEQVADFIFNTILATQPDKVVIDSIGIGFGIIGLTRHRIAEHTTKAINKTNDANTTIAWQTATHRPPIVEGFNGAARSDKNELYGNKRAELWWEARMLFQQGRVDTSKADNREALEAQLILPRYHINKGKIWVEDKAAIKQRLGRSPDNADAFLYGLWEAIQTTTLTLSAPTPAQVVQRHAVNVMAQRYSQQSRAAKLPNRRSA